MPLQRLSHLIGTLSLAEWRQHPWRHATVLLAVALGVALAYSVHLINASALSEFTAAVRAANGEPDVSLTATVPEGFDGAIVESLALDEAVAVVSPMLQLDSLVRRDATARALPVRVIGLDALRVAPVAPSLMPRPAAGSTALTVLDPDVVFANERELEELVHEPPCRVLVTKKGAEGVTVRWSGGAARYPALPAEVVDTTGAGDAFAAGFLLGDSAEDAARRGLEAAATCVAQVGAMPVAELR